MASNAATEQPKQTNEKEIAGSLEAPCDISSSVKSFTCNYSFSISSNSGEQNPSIGVSSVILMQNTAIDNSSGPMLQTPVACEDKFFPWKSELVIGLELPLIASSQADKPSLLECLLEIKKIVFTKQKPLTQC